MPPSPLGRLLVIANPASHSGRGAAGAKQAQAWLQGNPQATQGFEVQLTAAAGDAKRMAAGARAQGFDTVAMLGGDGIIHEAANGLLSLPPDERAKLAIIPMGSGNDYARTLRMARNDVPRALAQLSAGRIARLDTGRVNGEFFVQTLSFGLDAAIALDTTAKRAANTSQSGTALFVTSGIRIMSQARRGFKCEVSFDGGVPLQLDELVFAVQVGPTYGGGFRICPSASPADGLLSVCHNTRTPAIAHTLALFGLARFGRHVGSKSLKLLTARHIELDFAEQPPTQADGEPVLGTHFEIDSVPSALQVVVPQ